MTSEQQKQLDRLVAAGLVVSFAYGQCGKRGVSWSVDVLNLNTAEGFDSPYAADTFSQAIEIAVVESAVRGWRK